MKNSKQPNILFVLVDELRFPSVFPKGVNNAGEFLAAYMPNLYKLWESGVKFSNYHTAANACTPARGTLLTGLYSQQTWLCSTLTGDPTDRPDTTEKIAPTLDSAFPTYGSILRQANYRTPYIGKWHVSLLDPTIEGYGLDEYGFDGQDMVYPDPSGFNLQGTVGYHGDPPADQGTPKYNNDEDIAQAAVNWFHKEEENQRTDPWCLTVSFVNPHDREFFWAGTEIDRYNDLMLNNTPPAFTLYSQPGVGSGAPPINPLNNPLKDPKPLPFPPVPPNWESAEKIKAEKPSTQYMYRMLSGAIWGHASDDKDQTEFERVPYPGFSMDRPFEIGTAPYSYWKRGLDSYTQTMTEVDDRIGEVIEAFEKLSKKEKDNTVIVFASDHGEYAGAHGFLSGKLATAYKEAYHIPLIVVDPSGRFTAETNIIRDGMVSSVDILPMLASMGHNGNQNWLTGDYETMYGGRLNILPMLKSAKEPGRDYLLLVTDEIVPGFMNFNGAPQHVIGIQDKGGKLGTYAYANWVQNNHPIDWDSSNVFEIEYYDYTTKEGRAELNNTKNHPKAKIMADKLFHDLVPNELRKQLPGAIGTASANAKQNYLNWEVTVSNVTLSDFSGNDEESNSQKVHSFGRSL